MHPLIGAVPPCKHGEICGGCSLQHMATDYQVSMKQSVLVDQFKEQANLELAAPEPPLLGPTEGYRRKARLGVRYVTKRDEVLVGFREKRSGFITVTEECEVLDCRVGKKIEPLKALIRSLSAFQSIPQIEVAAGDDSVALVFRHLVPSLRKISRLSTSLGWITISKSFCSPKAQIRFGCCVRLTRLILVTGQTG